MMYSLLINWLVIILSSTETAAEVVECYNRTDNGAGYLGKITRPDCITWKEANSQFTNYYEDHKYCRNPLPALVSRPYCYTGPSSMYELCGGINECNVDCSMGLNSSLPLCDVLVTCQPPPSTADYHLSPNRTLFYVGERVYFQCAKNGFMPSSNYSTCHENGTFDHVECKGIICPFPLITNMEPQNRSEFYRFPESVNITCQTGYELIGLRIIHCTETGSWTQLPTCTGVQCEDLYYDSTMEMSIRLTDYRYPDVVEFSCKKNYELVGATVLQCQANGRWNERQPMCFENNGVSMATFASVVAVLTVIIVIAVVVIVKLLYVLRNKEQKSEQAYDDLKVNNSSRSRPENTDDTYTELR